ncbi:hypothetical protein PCANC_22953 [Puccinia coronata f. sp. avenae]|uniref:Uncharacterized protein n=1 Tax=Puccinia coronata f. sp. avenae TaxID=200324 RepID=A0A2N5SQF2_9BASI|nr:hypothetical protein PCANC_22953 [Puccinia coronata f. sp. avenae]
MGVFARRRGRATPDHPGNTSPPPDLTSLRASHDDSNKENRTKQTMTKRLQESENSHVEQRSLAERITLRDKQGGSLATRIDQTTNDRKCRERTLH